MLGRRPRVVRTFPGEVGVPGAALRVGRRRAEVVVVTTAPTAAWLATWCADFAQTGRPLGEQPADLGVLRALREAQGRRTALAVLPPPPVPTDLGIAMLDRVAGLLAAEPDLVPAPERAAVLREVVDRVPRTTTPAVPRVPDGLAEEVAGIERWITTHDVAVHGQRDLLDVPTPAPAPDPDAVVDATAQLLTEVLDELRRAVRRQRRAAQEAEADG